MDESAFGRQRDRRKTTSYPETMAVSNEVVGVDWELEEVGGGSFLKIECQA